MKLPDYAKAIGISYTTAWRWWKANKLPHPARQTESGLIIVDYSHKRHQTKLRKTESPFIAESHLLRTKIISIANRSD